MKNYYLTNKGAKLTGLPVGYKMVASNTPDVYRVGTRGSRGFVDAMGVTSCVYFLDIMCYTLTDPNSRSVKGPWYLNADIKFDFDLLPNGKKFQVSISTNDDTKSMFLCINPYAIKDSYLVTELEKDAREAFKVELAGIEDKLILPCSLDEYLDTIQFPTTEMLYNSLLNVKEAI